MLNKLFAAVQEFLDNRRARRLTDAFNNGFNWAAGSLLAGADPQGVEDMVFGSRDFDYGADSRQYDDGALAACQLWRQLNEQFARRARAEAAPSKGVTAPPPSREGFMRFAPGAEPVVVLVGGAGGSSSAFTPPNGPAGPLDGDGFAWRGGRELA